MRTLYYIYVQTYNNPIIMTMTLCLAFLFYKPCSTTHAAAAPTIKTADSAVANVMVDSCFTASGSSI